MKLKSECINSLSDILKGIATLFFYWKTHYWKYEVRTKLTVGSSKYSLDKEQVVATLNFWGMYSGAWFLTKFQ